METIENPYALPPAFEPREDAESLLRAAMRMYRWIGWCGVAYVVIAFPVPIVTQLLQPQPNIPLVVPLLGMLMMLFFVLMLRTASRLGHDFDRVYRRARWLAILAAAIWFPLFTIPGILAVRRLERYRRYRADPIDGSPWTGSGPDAATPNQGEASA
jgi:hypothetical protein